MAGDKPTQGTFCWNELMTTDPDKARDFYKKLVGWKIADSGMPGMKYEMLQAGDKQVGGLMKVPDDAKGMPSQWIAYITVDDVDACAAKVKDLGGQVLQGPMDIPTVGRMVMIKDPTGALVSLITLAM